MISVGGKWKVESQKWIVTKIEPEFDTCYLLLGH